MPLPRSLQSTLEQALDTADKLLVKSERYRLSEAYRDPMKSDHHKARIENSYQRLSYLATRVPATYAVCETVFSRLAAYDLSFSSLLDLGSGPGTAAICAKYIFPELTSITCIDRDKAFKDFAESFLTTPHYSDTKIRYDLHELGAIQSYPTSDLTTISYALNELDDATAQNVVNRAFEATRTALILIEPGTPKGFQGLLKRRAELINYGASILAPCPHDGPCPMTQTDWCHFSVRVERSDLHKYIKDATLTYEDEKFCYVIAVKSEAICRPNNRIIKKPQRRKGHQIFDLCTPDGLQKKTITKSEKTAYKSAKSCDWGDVLSED